MPSPSLKEFAQAIPVCDLTSGLGTMLEIFHSSGSDAIVVVNEQQCPLGIINLRQVMPYLMPTTGLEENPFLITSADFHKPLSQLEPSLIEPLATLPAQQNLSQFLAHLGEWGIKTEHWEPGRSQNSPNSPTPQLPNSSNSPLPSSEHWALVDVEGKFIGLLNSWLLLKSLAPKFEENQAIEVPEPPPTKFDSLVQLLEQLPLPMSLQTSTGTVLAQNLTWRQQIGTSSDLDSQKHSAARGLESPARGATFTCNSSVMPQSGDGLIPSVLRFIGSTSELHSTLRSEHSNLPDGGTASTQRSPLTAGNVTRTPHQPSGEAEIQYHCALDTPYMAAAVSKRRVMLSGFPVIQATDDEGLMATIETRQINPERVFSFVRIPLSPSFFPQPQEENREQQKSGSGSISDVYIVLAQDMTEQQQVTKELAAKNADLIQLNRLKDEFLACISHELKTPLTAILGLSSLLKDQSLGTLNERQARYATLIYHSGRQLMTVVNDILDLTRMETGQLELTLEPVQIQNVCDRAYAQAQQRPSEKDHKEDDPDGEINFTLEIEPGLERLVADELRLRQMLMHLLSNAIKFTDPDGEIGLKVSRWEGWIAFTVWDTGMGIPAEKQHLIFQKFQQLEKPLTRRFEGTGLGLVLTQRLARLHGGDVSFISKVDQGSQFTLLLPPIPPQGSKGSHEQRSWENEEMDNWKAGETAQAAIPSLQTASRNRLVLIVETVPQYLENLTEQLQNLGYRIIVARSGMEAIEKARSLQPCTVFLNPLIPQLSGWDALTLLKSDAQTSHIPVIITATQAEKQQAYHNKADGFLSLPVQEQALSQCLTSFSEHIAPTYRSLTILHLNPELNDTPSESSLLSSELAEVLSLQNSELNYRVLEADDLDQAELLARVWHLDVVLLDSTKLTDSLAYLKQFASYKNLTALPIVTLDHQTTEAANHIKGLSVYPCLAVDHLSRIAALLQVIQVAAGMSRKPNILIMDIGAKESKEDFSHSNPKAQLLTSSTPSSSWLPALSQYLETAGFGSLISASWAEVHRQLQDQSVDLMLLRVRDSSDDSALVNGLKSLNQLSTKPPMLVLDHRLDEVKAGNNKSNSELESLLLNMATQILPGHSQSMSQLLHLINQTLVQN